MINQCLAARLVYSFMLQYIYIYKKYIKHLKSQVFSYQNFPPKVYRMLTFVYDTNGDTDIIANTYNDDDMYIAIALLQLCLTAVLETQQCTSMHSDFIYDIYM